MAKILIVCGGTGGHLTPGIAIAEELSERGHACILVVSRKKVDKRLVRKYPHMEFVDAPGAPFSLHPLALLKFIRVQGSAFIFAMGLLKRTRPDLILGFGGFLSAGVALPGVMKGIPFVLHEANRVVGRSNRLLSRFADRLFLPDGVELGGIGADKIIHAGLPLRKEFQPLEKMEARKVLAIRPAEKLLVVFGGSQGAGSLNSWAQENREILAEKGVSIYCLTGLGKELPGEFFTETREFGRVTSWFVPFSDSMPAVLSAADAVISRAGAGSIAEIIRCRIPAILIPYPYARDDHQTANAQYVVARGGALLVEESQMSRLLDEVTELLFNSWKTENMRGPLQRMDRPREANRLADALEGTMVCRVSEHSTSAIPSEKA